MSNYGKCRRNSSLEVPTRSTYGRREMRARIGGRELTLLMVAMPDTDRECRGGRSKVHLILILDSHEFGSSKSTMTSRVIRLR